MKVHTEATFEKLITEHLVLHGGYEPRGRTSYDPDDALATHAGYDVQRALIPAEVTAFVQATQLKPWPSSRPSTAPPSKAFSLMPCAR